MSKYPPIFPDKSVKSSYRYIHQNRYFHPCVEALIPLIRYAKSSYANILIEKHKNKAITQKVHKVLVWFDQPCLAPRIRNNIILYGRKYYEG